MKKILLIMFCLVLLVGSVSAGDFLPIKQYDELTQTITIKNILGLGRDISTIQLRSSLHEELETGYQNVSMFEINLFDDTYADAFKKMEFFDLNKDWEKFERSFDYKYLTTELVDVDYYGEVCSLDKINGTINCVNEIIGTHKEEKKVWKDLDIKTLTKGKVTIGIFTEVKVRDNVEWIPTLFSKTINEWAGWTAVSTENWDVPLGGHLAVNSWTVNGVALEYGIIKSVVILSGDSGDVQDVTITIEQNGDTLASITEGMGGSHTRTYTFLLSDYNNDGRVISPNLDGGAFTITANKTSGDIRSSDSDLSHSGSMWTATNQRPSRSGNTNPGKIVYEYYTCVDGSPDNEGKCNIFYPNVTLNSPIDTYKSTSKTITFNATVYTLSNYDVVNVSLKLDGVINETNSSGFNATDYIFTKTFDDGNYNWTIEAWDNNSQRTTASVRTFTIDTIDPVINISSPNETSYNYLTYGTNFTLNTTITDATLDKCWYDYNNTNTTFSCSTGVLNSQNLTITNHTTITIYANDSIGHLSSESFSWTYNLFDFNEYTYSENITESTPTTFSGKFQTGSSLSSSYLEYNNTNNSISINSLGGNRYTLTSSLTTPSVNTDKNITWFFWVNSVNATSYNQTVTNINLDNCDTYTFYLVNYTLVDELSQENIVNVNSTIETTIIIKTITGGEIAQFNQTFNGSATASVCSEFNLNTSGLRLWEQSRYGSTDHVFEQHNIQNASMTSLPNEITLRDLPSTSATTFRIAYKSATFLPIANAVVEIQRKYLGEGIFKSVESPLTDTSGETSASLDLNSVLYRIIVSKNGETLATFENPAVACDNILTGDCSITINERDSATLINNYDVENNFNYGLYQENRTITLTFSIPSGENRLVNLFVNETTILGDKTSCNQTLYATSGQLQCDIAEGLGDVYLAVEVSADNILIRKASTTILEDRSQYFGTDNIVLTFFLVLSLTLLMISSPITVLIGLVIGLIASSLMLLLNSGDIFGVAPVLTYLIIIVILLIVKISGRENR